ncbi:MULTISPECIES: hypothetical protein [unclassified Granulicatella]|uniref:hypothetical protein n=1 Tax=unclassified Granulicatella TaxID=2630493 RepID=UPI00107425B6|nr:MULTISPECIES: hypothetical protein [unclassified Granulicatella]MBF0779793.1 hypothetical protein [Granulicatella sp. 19428wC4_WM01]TFU96195.1 hypothetical protein E4T68_01675 [Granulicatella sp. WM01]
MKKQQLHNGVQMIDVTETAVPKQSHTIKKYTDAEVDAIIKKKYAKWQSSQTAQLVSVHKSNVNNDPSIVCEKMLSKYGVKRVQRELFIQVQQLVYKCIDMTCGCSVIDKASMENSIQDIQKLWIVLKEKMDS